MCTQINLCCSHPDQMADSIDGMCMQVDICRSHPDQVADRRDGMCSPEVSHSHTALVEHYCTNGIKFLQSGD